MLKLNLGFGNWPINGYENIDIANGKKVYPLMDYADNSVDEIRASHILEHFAGKEVEAVLADWTAKLKIGGVLKIAVPDFGLLVKAYVNGEVLNYVGYICGGQTDENDFHKMIFDENCLREYLKTFGFVDIRKWKSEIADCASYDISLNLQGIKREKEKEI